MYNINHLKLHSEDKLMLCCARTSIDSETREKILYLIDDDLDWEYLLKIALTHGLTPLLYYNLNSICPEKVPKHIIMELKNYFNANTLKNLFITGELIKLTDLFNSYGIKAFTYKGPVLSILAYNNLSLRTFSDIDIFVNSKDIKKSFNLLKRHGYKSKLPLMLKKVNNYLKYHRAHVFNNGNVNIDLQWKLSFIYIKSDLLTKFNFENLIKINFNNSVFFTPNIEYQIIILSLHNASHLWNSLSLLSDLYGLICNNEIDWDVVMSLAAKIGIKRILLINIILLNNLLGLKYQNEINYYFQDKKAEKLTIKINEQLLKQGKIKNNFLNRGILQFQIRENKLYGLRDMLYLLFNPTEEDYKTVSLPHLLYKLYFGVRFINLIKKIFKC